ncbi:hypothetical protein Vadar_023588 [Vaccinium darrowii]|uniref:Uncharacterized protein n=1 Tax=Vaccinium darrowii TaxID=229202 RepID=A0ACB7ZLD1_9ERIC|nr:hypothetical protein Vadar_023588 [Vaccinium darrowii]
MNAANKRRKKRWRSSRSEREPEAQNGNRTKVKRDGWGEGGWVRCREEGGWEIAGRQRPPKGQRRGKTKGARVYFFLSQVPILLSNIQMHKFRKGTKPLWNLPSKVVQLDIDVFQLTNISQLFWRITVETVVGVKNFDYHRTINWQGLNPKTPASILAFLSLLGSLQLVVSFELKAPPDLRAFRLRCFVQVLRLRRIFELLGSAVIFKLLGSVVSSSFKALPDLRAFRLRSFYLFEWEFAKEKTRKGCRDIEASL